jgi:hypothetical protein
MSDQSNRQARDVQVGGPGRARRRPIAVYESYEAAEHAVDRLSDLQFPVERVAIVGHDLELVEQVTGRATYLTSAGRGAATGAVPGLLIGWIFGLFNLLNPLVTSLVLAFYGLIFGAVVGAVLGVIMHALQRGGRDFHAVRLMVPTRYEVVVDDELADDATRLLARSPAASTRQIPPSPRPQ